MKIVEHENVMRALSSIIPEGKSYFVKWGGYDDMGMFVSFNYHYHSLANEWVIFNKGSFAIHVDGDNDEVVNVDGEKAVSVFIPAGTLHLIRRLSVPHTYLIIHDQVDEEELISDKKIPIYR